MPIHENLIHRDWPMNDPGADPIQYRVRLVGIRHRLEDLHQCPLGLEWVHLPAFFAEQLPESPQPVNIAGERTDHPEVGPLPRLSIFNPQQVFVIKHAAGRNRRLESTKPSPITM